MLENVNEELFWKKVNILSEKECWEWNASCRNNGYGIFKTKNKNHSSHRLSYELKFGEINNNKLFVCHKCDNKKCVNPNHLFLGTQSDNMKDCYNKNRMVIPEGKRFIKGQESFNAKVKSEIVIQISKIIQKRRDNQEILNLKQLSKEFNISYTTIRDISCGRIYKNI